MYRRLENGENRPVEGFMGQPAKMLLEPGHELAIIQLWHGNCLEAEVEVKSFTRGTETETLVTLREKKELRADAPIEATQCGP